MKKYYKDIDLFRIMLTVFVLLYHMGILKGGFLAVTCFFFLSGYLASLSLSKRGKVSVKEYYVNQIKRLYIPLVIVTLITCLVLSLTESNYFNLKWEVTSILLGYNNYWQIGASMDYFARHINSPFMHLWYIAILLQFDLVFPWLYMGFKRLGDKCKKFMPALVSFGLGCLSFGYFTLEMVRGNVMVAYYGTLSRIFALLWGVSLGFIFQYYGNKMVVKDKKKRKIIFWGYMILLASLFILGNDKGYLMPLEMLIAVFITVRIICYGTLENRRGKKNMVIKSLAGVSYFVYLVQYPVIFFLQDIMEKNYWYYGAVSLLTFALAYIIYYLLRGFSRKTLRYIGYGILLILTATGGYFYVTSKDYSKEIDALEKSLLVNEELMEQAQEEYLARKKGENDEWLLKIQDLEDGKQELSDAIHNLDITLVGDSVMLGAYDSLHATFPKGYLDAETSRTAWVVDDILLALKRREALGKTVVLGLGVNGDVPKAEKEKIMETLKDSDVFWINVPNNDYVNNDLKAFANLYDNLYIVDFDKVAKGHPEYFIADGVHLTYAGAEAYAKEIYDTIYSVYLEEYQRKVDEVTSQYDSKLKNEISFYGDELLVNSFNYIKEEFAGARFVTLKNGRYEDLKKRLEEDKQKGYLTHKIVLMMSRVNALEKDEYLELIKSYKDYDLYILLMDDTYIPSDEVVIMNFYEEIRNNSDYALGNSAYLTDKGNRNLALFLEKWIK